MRSNPLFLLVILTACFDDDSGTNSVTPAGTVDAEIVWGNSSNDLTEVQQSFGTQVGSEGFWGCQVSQITVLAGDAIVDGFDRSVDDVVNDHAGAWPLSFDADDGGDAAGALVLGVLSTNLVAFDGGCESYVAVEVMASLSRGGDAPVAMAGTLAIAPSRAGLVVAAPGAMDPVEASWGTSTLPDASWLQVEADLDALSLVGEVAFTNCAGMSCTEREPLAALEGTR